MLYPLLYYILFYIANDSEHSLFFSQIVQISGDVLRPRSPDIIFQRRRRQQHPELLSDDDEATSGKTRRRRDDDDVSNRARSVSLDRMQFVDGGANRLSSKVIHPTDDEQTDFVDVPKLMVNPLPGGGRSGGGGGRRSDDLKSSGSKDSDREDFGISGRNGPPAEAIAEAAWGSIATKPSNRTARAIFKTSSGGGVVVARPASRNVGIVTPTKMMQANDGERLGQQRQKAKKEWNSVAAAHILGPEDSDQFNSRLY